MARRSRRPGAASNVGSTARVSRVTIPSAPRCTTCPSKSGSPAATPVQLAVGADVLDPAHRGRQRAEPVAGSMGAGRGRPADRDVRQRSQVVERPAPLLEPEREVAVPDAGARRDVRECSSRTGAGSTSVTVMSVPSVSARSWNECRVPRARTRPARPRTASCTCSIEVAFTMLRGGEGVRPRPGPSGGRAHVSDSRVHSCPPSASAMSRSAPGCRSERCRTC